MRRRFSGTLDDFGEDLRCGPRYASCLFPRRVPQLFGKPSQRQATPTTDQLHARYYVHQTGSHQSPTTPTTSTNNTAHREDAERACLMANWHYSSSPKPDPIHKIKTPGGNLLHSGSNLGGPSPVSGLCPERDPHHTASHVPVDETWADGDVA